jgi:hypothetical protein
MFRLVLGVNQFDTKMDFKERGTWVCRLGSTDTELGPMVDSVGHGNKPPRYIEGGKFSDQLGDLFFFKKDCFYYFVNVEFSASLRKPLRAVFHAACEKICDTLHPLSALNFYF